MSQQKPGWYNVPGKGRRYWNGSNYQFYGPSDNPAAGGRTAYSGDIAGYWNNFVNQWGSSTSNPTQVGEQSFTQQQVRESRRPQKPESEVSNGGLIDFGVGGQRVVAPKDGVMGYMIPGKPDSWVADGDQLGISAETRERAKERYARANSGKTPATAQPPEHPQEVGGNYTVAGVEYDGKTGRPVGAPEGGYSLEPDGTMTPHSSGSGGGDTRTNVNGLRQYGQTLGGLNEFTQAFTGLDGVTDIKATFESEALPTTPAGERQGHEGGRTNYSWDSEGEEGVWNEETGRIEMPSAPGTTGGKPENTQDGTSDKPDIADNVRQIRMERNSGRGSRRNPRNRGEDSDMFAQPEPSDESLTSPMYSNARRNEIRSAFLDLDTPIIKASVKANAIAGYGKDSDGNARFNYGGELVNAKPGMQQQAKNAAMMGQDPSQYLDIPTTGDVEPDQPADSEISMTAPIKDMTEDQQKEAAQLFAQGFVSDISGKLKDK